ncbi:MAG: hypothetical protein J2P37_30050 [Ktedonobacteraceae bacterium]|nr:hypothetical protein [Ktedonobacteraceae bacterium]
MIHTKKLWLFLRSRLTLIVIALLCELLYLYCFVRPFPLLSYYQNLTDMGNITGNSRAGFFLYVLPFTVLFALVGFAWWEVRYLRDKATLWLILGFGLLFTITMAFVYPVTAIDVFGYIVQSLILIQHHANPMITPASTFPNDSTMYLAGGWANAGSPYGPLGILVDAIPTWLAGRNLLINLLLLKLLFSALLLLEAYLIYIILSTYAPQLALAGALFIAWNPQALFEYSANSHNDVVLMLFVLLAILALTKERHLLAFGLLVASVLFKYTTAPLVPLFFIYSFTRQPNWSLRLRYAGLAIGIGLGMVAIAFAPFWAGPTMFQNFLDQDNQYISSFSNLLAEAIQIPFDQAKLSGRIVFGICYLGALYLCTRNLQGLLWSGFIALFCFLGFASGKFEAWYTLWPMLLAILLPNIVTAIAMLLFAYGAALLHAIFAYLWVWSGRSGPMFETVNTLSYLVAFAPALLLLTIYLLKKVLPAMPGKSEPS